jgi:hypothetical protein
VFSGVFGDCVALPPSPLGEEREFLACAGTRFISVIISPARLLRQ